MVNAEIDHAAIIARIAAILQANTNFYNPSGGKVRNIVQGHPDEPYPYPYCYIAFMSETDQPFEAVSVTGSPAFMTYNTSQHVVVYNIVFAVDRSRRIDAEADFVALHKACKEALKGNVDLRNPADGTNALVKTSVPKSSSVVRGVSRGGQSIIGCTIQLECLVFTN